MTSRARICFFSFAALVSLADSRCILLADETDWASSPSGVLAFADRLFEEEDYHRAISEYKRFVYLFPREPRIGQARFKMGMSYQRSGYLENAIEVFDGILAERPSPEVARSVEYEIGKCLFLGGDYSRSSESLKGINTQRSLALAGWALLRARKYRDASDCFALAREVEPGGYLDHLCGSLSRESLGGDSIPRKSARLAALLSAPVPGAGRVYSGRVGDGIFSFLLVAASYVGAYSYHQDEEHALSLGLLGLGLLFHAGDVYGAFNSARLYNSVGQEDFVKGIESRHNLGGILLD